MNRIPDEQVIGLRFSRLTVESFAGKTKAKKRLVQCLCECGARKVVCLSAIRSGTIKSCGCLLREIAATNIKKVQHLGAPNRLRHGMTHAPEFYVWRTMKSRCLNPKTHSFHRYGGRGIKVCDRWLVFDNFFADMGKRPSPKHQLDRKDNDGHYEPSNCRWATAIEQGRNRSTNVRITHLGETLTMVEWAERLGITKRALHGRIKSGMSIERCLVGPIRHRRLKIS